eukprot:34216-Eustigmatos_ZCMA.PRE.1
MPPPMSASMKTEPSAHPTEEPPGLAASTDRQNARTRTCTHLRAEPESARRGCSLPLRGAQLP